MSTVAVVMCIDIIGGGWNRSANPLMMVFGRRNEAVTRPTTKELKAKSLKPTATVTHRPLNQSKFSAF